MSADHHDDDRDAPARPEGKDNTTLVVALLLGGVALLGLMVCGGVLLFWLQAVPGPGPNGGAGVVAPAKTVYSREELKRALEGKSEQDVIDLLGTPDRTTASGRETMWTYYDRTIDPASGKTDAAAAIWLADGKVSRFGF